MKEELLKQELVKRSHSERGVIEIRVSEKESQ
jgi:hypothetical protein